jgi:hypothetical protein
MQLSDLKNIIDQKHLLKELSKEKSKYRNSILKNADKPLITAICESVLNILFGNIKLEPLQLEKLKKYKSALRTLIKKSSISKKKGY